VVAYNLGDKPHNYTFSTAKGDPIGYKEEIVSFINRHVAGDLVIGKAQTKSWSAYNWKDIIIESDDESTGQLTGLTSGNTVLGKIKLKKTVTGETWYALGFPFDAEVYYEDTPLRIYTEADGGNFWLKDYDGVLNTFDYTTDTYLQANKGYIVMFPEGWAGKEVTFVSKDATTTLVDATEATITSSLEDGYHLIANPSVSNITLTTTDRYYVYNLLSGNFELLETGTKTIKPFESVVTVLNAPLRPAIGDGLTGLDKIILPAYDNDPVISTRYYNLNGIELRQPEKNGVSLIKKVHASGKTEIVKELRNEK
jgi:hypothetical protein